jgi:hypothetical protein
MGNNKVYLYCTQVCVHIEILRQNWVHLCHFHKRFCNASGSQLVVAIYWTKHVYSVLQNTLLFHFNFLSYMHATCFSLHLGLPQACQYKNLTKQDKSNLRGPFLQPLFLYCRNTGIYIYISIYLFIYTHTHTHTHIKLHSVRPQQNVIFMKLAIVCSRLSRIQQTLFGTGIGKFRKTNPMQRKYL